MTSHFTLEEEPLCSMALEEISSNIMAHEIVGQKLRIRPSYPIETRKSEILDTIEKHTVSLIKASNGSGKSTQVQVPRHKFCKSVT